MIAPSVPGGAAWIPAQRRSFVKPLGNAAARVVRPGWQSPVRRPKSAAHAMRHFRRNSSAGLCAAFVSPELAPLELPDRARPRLV